MPNRRHHDPKVERKLIGAGLREEFSLKEHAGPFAELNNWAGHALFAVRKMRRRVERDGI